MYGEKSGRVGGRREGTRNNERIKVKGLVKKECKEIFEK
jgi:hypothetical protein